MPRKILMFALLLGIFSPLPVFAQTHLVRFEGGIGSQPLRSGPAVNVVFNVNPGGIPWVISRLSADVSLDGKISVIGLGLLLAGGNNIGTPSVPPQSVRARLFCGGVAHDSDVVQLEANGDFRIEGRLDPTPPSPCANPVLLIVSAGGNWFAAGIQKP
jgi:hypothetical protein